MKRVMIDMETFGVGTRPVILSLGAVLFDEASSEVLDSFYSRIDPKTCVGLTLDPDTIFWWLRQAMENPLAVRALLDDPGRDLVEVLADFTNWLPEGGVGEIWSNGATADLIWLASAFAAVGVDHPWTHREERCYRTKRADMKRLGWIDRDFEGVQHHAGDDARHQALNLVEFEASLTEHVNVEEAIVRPLPESHPNHPSQAR